MRVYFVRTSTYLRSALVCRLKLVLCLAVLTVWQFFSLGSVSFGNTHGASLPILGTWLTQSESEITIEECDFGYCGFISKIVIPQHIRDKYGDDLLAAQGEFTDEMNKDPALRSRLIQGLQILVLHTQSDHNRIDGSIYNPENGETFEGFVEVQDANNIRLSGCVLFNLICMGEDWTRVIESENTSVLG